jgi:hypothetical protein
MKIETSRGNLASAEQAACRRKEITNQRIQAEQTTCAGKIESAAEELANWARATVSRRETLQREKWTGAQLAREGQSAPEICRQDVRAGD